MSPSRPMTCAGRKAVLAWLAAAVLLLVSLLPAAAQQEAAVGHIVERSGAASIIRAGATLDAVPGTPVFVGDTVATGGDAQLGVLFEDRAMLTVGPRARVEIAQFYVRPADRLFRGVLSLLSGIVRVSLFARDDDKGFEVRTRTAVASVRSTEWIVELAGDSTAVLALEGRVTVDAVAGGTVVLGPGEGTDVAAGAAPLAPARWPAARFDDAVARTRLR